MPWAVAGAVIALGGTIYSSEANKSAAKTAANAQTQSAKVQSDAIDKQIAAIKQGVAESQQLYERTREETQPGVTYLRNVIASPADLTPEQERARDDLVRRVTNSSQVAGSALRGSGRSFVDAMRAIESDFTNTALDQNRTRADAAARDFAAPNFNASGQEAAITGSGATQVGNAIANQGGVNGQGITDAATTKANGALASAGLVGNGLGQIGSMIGQQVKQNNTSTSAPTGTSYNPGTGEWTTSAEGF